MSAPPGAVRRLSSTAPSPSVASGLRHRGTTRASKCNQLHVAAANASGVSDFHNGYEPAGYRDEPDACTCSGLNGLGLTGGLSGVFESSQLQWMQRCRHAGVSRWQLPQDTCLMGLRLTTFAIIFSRGFHSVP